MGDGRLEPQLYRRVTILRVVTAAGVVASAHIHLVLYLDSYRRIEVVGPLFLVNAIAGFAIAVAVVLWRHWLGLLLAIGFSAATLLAFYVSVTVGFFGVQERLGGGYQVGAAVAEWISLIAATWALVIERRAAR